ESRPLAEGQETWIETTSVVGPGTLTFWWKISCEDGYAFLDFYVDGGDQEFVTGEANWARVATHLEAGVHELRWSYSKYFDSSIGADKAWVDQVSFVPDNP